MKRSRKVLGNLLELLLVLVSCLTPHCCSTLFLLGGNGRQFTPKGGGSWPASKSSECGLPVSETAVGTYLPLLPACGTPGRLPLQGHVLTPRGRLPTMFISEPP